MDSNQNMAKPRGMNQHPPMHHEGWMINSQETDFVWVPAP